MIFKGNPIKGEEQYKRRLLECRSIAIIDGEIVRKELVPTTARNKEFTPQTSRRRDLMPASRSSASMPFADVYEPTKVGIVSYH